jgi:hypothetical protein
MARPCQKMHRTAGHQLLMPVTLANQEADIRRIWFEASPGQIIHETLSRKYPTHKKEWKNGSSGRVPASHCETLSSKPSTAKTKQHTHTHIHTHTHQVRHGGTQL